jgi:hypothetical protein
VHGTSFLLTRTMEKRVTSSIQEFLERDHERLDRLLAQSLVDSHVDRESFDEFRKGMLKHIGIEEKILFPVAKSGSTEEQAIAARLRIQHGAIAALLVLDPSPASIRTLAQALQIHNPIEEGRGGFYAACEQLTTRESQALIEEMKSAPEVPVASRMQTAKLLESVKRTLERAGFPGTLL